MEQGGITSVIVIDDAFDPPAIGDAEAGPLLDLLTLEEHGWARKKARLSDGEIAAAAEALQTTEYAEEAVTLVVCKLYAKFVEKFDARFDPAGRFNILKGSNLSFVRPLLRLLGKCQGLSVSRVGSNDTVAELGAAAAQVVFVDYYLDRSFTAESDPNSVQGAEARQASIRMLRAVLDAQPGAGPSVMLMSSHKVASRAQEFRAEIRDAKRPIFASRFHYMAKEDLREEQDDTVEVAPAAADALLDIAQRHAFAGAVEEALTHWKDGVDGAVESLWKIITELELKDFAYLSRFRLADEGPLSSYLEWFFGEVLIDAIARKVDWKQPSWTVLDEASSKGRPGSQIEGAFDGPTGRIAELYYRARVDERPERQNKDMRVGDIYTGSHAGEVLAVITPECDLVMRSNRKRSAPRLTVVAGRLQPLSGPDTSVADFLMRDGEPVNVVWSMKDIRTVEFEAIGGEGGHRLLGTLRPLYAYELQRRVLNELGRVGLAVAPAMAVNARASVVARGKNGRIALELSNRADASCAVIPKRGGTDKPRVIYRRSFADEVLERLIAAKDDIHPDAAGELGSLLTPKSQNDFVEKLCRTGQQDGETALGVLTTLSPENTGASPPWCQILVEFHPDPDAADEDPADEGPVEPADGLLPGPVAALAMGAAAALAEPTPQKEVGAGNPAPPFP